MIKVEVFYKEKEVDRVLIKGHANYADYGYDIVCSGVSSIVITTINAIISFNENYIQYTSCKDDFTEIKIIEQNQITKILISNMLRMLREMEENYPKNIKIKEEK